MVCDFAYPIEYFLVPYLTPLGGEKLEKFTRIFSTMLNGFSCLNHEREVCQARPKDYWKYIKIGHFRDDEAIEKYKQNIVDRFRKINQESRFFRDIDLFIEPNDVVCSYFIRDIMVLFLEKPKAERISKEKDIIFKEFQQTKQSETLKEIIGEEKYNVIIKNYKSYILGS